MELHLDSSTKYFNDLDTAKFAKMLDDPTQCYKFYWLDAILTLMINTDQEMSFDSLFDEMIISAWHSVTKYHLRLGPSVQGISVNLLEQAVMIVNLDSELPRTASKSDLLETIKRKQILYSIMMTDVLERLFTTIQVLLHPLRMRCLNIAVITYTMTILFITKVL